jgi:hypothetical protein
MTQPVLWHVTLVAGGAPVAEAAVVEALERLSSQWPFLLQGRYSSERIELRYWEEAPDIETAFTLAVTLWRDHQRSAVLPAQWDVQGVEVNERSLHQRRVTDSRNARSAAVVGGWRRW